MKPFVASAALWGTDTKEIVKFLDSHSNWLKYSDDILTNSLHTAGWWLVKGMYLVSVSLEKLVDKSLDLLTFSSGNLADKGSIGSSDLDIVSSGMINTIVIALFTLTLVFLGLKFVIGKTPPNFKSVWVNLMISVVLIMGLPFIMWELANVSKSFYDESKTLANVNGNSKDESLSFGLVKNNTADLLYLTKKGYDPIKNSAGSNEAKNNMSEKTFLLSGTSEILTKDVIGEINKKDRYNEKETEALGYKLSTDLDGNLSAYKTEDSMWSVFSDSLKGGYQRFSIPTFTVLVGLIAVSVAFLFSILTIVTATFELGVAKIVSVLVFATDLETGEKTKTVIQDIMTAYMVIAMTGVNLSLYSLFISFISSKDLNLILYVLCLIGSTFILMKGSKTIMRYFGADVGLSSSMGQLLATGALAKMAFTGGSNKGKQKKETSTGEHQNTSDGRGDDRTGRKFGESVNNFKKKAGDASDSLGKGIKSTANTAGSIVGYAKNRGVGGMINDGKFEAASKSLETLDNTKSKAKEKAIGAAEGAMKPFNAAKSGLDNVKSEFDKGREKGAKLATINTLSDEVISGKGSADKALEEMENKTSRTDANSKTNAARNHEVKERLSNQINGTDSVEELEKNTKRTDANSKTNAARNHEVKERLGNNAQGADSIEELEKNTKRTDANSKNNAARNHEVKERLGNNAQGADSIEELEKNTKRTDANAKGNTASNHEIKEKLGSVKQGMNSIEELEKNVQTTSGTRNVTEKVQPSATTTSGTRNVTEKVQPSATTTSGTRNVTEKVQPSATTTSGTRNVTEKVQPSATTTSGTRNVTEKVQPSATTTSGTRNVTEKVQPSATTTSGTRNVTEKVQPSAQTTSGTKNVTEKREKTLVDYSQQMKENMPKSTKKHSNGLKNNPFFDRKD
ncbi:pLS20_p028 family conjugation system transmembrane protein [Brochothrix thermosphacta]|uniref:pLS20_p028 family conjugation system transmembrane protein n=2 Tax=Brochothrix thermosphacta TaxID=2756 RepID=UPI001146FF74|nr:hypothetical protein [Brochothrix thermosphacta]